MWINLTQNQPLQVKEYWCKLQSVGDKTSPYIKYLLCINPLGCKEMVKGLLQLEKVMVYTIKVC